MKRFMKRMYRIPRCSPSWEKRGYPRVCNLKLWPVDGSSAPDYRKPKIRRTKLEAPPPVNEPERTKKTKGIISGSKRFRDDMFGDSTLKSVTEMRSDPQAPAITEEIKYVM